MLREKYSSGKIQPPRPLGRGHQKERYKVAFEDRTINFRSSYEVRTSKILEEKKKQGTIKEWVYEEDKFIYIRNGKNSTYLPDFKIIKIDEEIEFIEVKGYKRDSDDLKIAAVRNQGFDISMWFLVDIEREEEEILGAKSP